MSTVIDHRAPDVAWVDSQGRPRVGWLTDRDAAPGRAWTVDADGTHWTVFLSDLLRVVQVPGEDGAPLDSSAVLARLDRIHEELGRATFRAARWSRDRAKQQLADERAAWAIERHRLQGDLEDAQRLLASAHRDLLAVGKELRAHRQPVRSRRRPRRRT